MMDKEHIVLLVVGAVATVVMLSFITSVTGEGYRYRIYRATSTGYCGDGVISSTEACDSYNLGGRTCASMGFSAGTLRCNSYCTGFDVSGCYMSGTHCGDGVINPTEACDGNNLGGLTCTSLGFSGGVLSCSSNCQLDTSRCTRGDSCGDGVIGSTEACDTYNLGGKTCTSFGYSGGTLRCNPYCTGYDFSSCSASGTRNPYLYE